MSSITTLSVGTRMNAVNVVKITDFSIAGRITANKAPRILDVEGFFFSYLRYV